MAKQARIKIQEVQTVPDEIAEKPLRTSSAKLCAFCKHTYLRPCTEKTHKECPNWQFLQRRK